MKEDEEEYQPSCFKPDPITFARQITYAIGDYNRGRYAMWFGPHPDEMEMLEEPGHNNSSRIIRFNQDGTETILWKWKVDRWVKVK
jgi:hypothetical protein